MDVVDMGTSSAGASARTALSDHIFAVLKEKPAPELCLDSQTLEVGEDHTTMFWQISPIWRRGWEGKPLGHEKESRGKLTMRKCSGDIKLLISVFCAAETKEMFSASLSVELQAPSTGRILKQNTLA